MDDHQKDVGHLIESLASKNAMPMLNQNRILRPTFPDGYSKEEEERVREAVEQLISVSPAVLSTLAEYLEDKRYSLTREEGNGYWSNWQVGMVCRYIIRKQIQPLEHILRHESRRDSNLIPSGAEEYEAFKRRLQHESLADLQYTWLKRALATELAVSFESKQEEKRIIGVLSNAIAELIESGKPIAVQQQFLLRPK